MKKVLRFLNFNQYSFSTKVILSFFAFIIIFILIKMLLSIPIVEKRNLDNEIDFISKSLLITKEKILIIGKSLRMQSSLERELSLKKIENEIKNIDLRDIKNIDDLMGFVERNEILKLCDKEILEFDEKFQIGKWKNIQVENRDRKFLKKRLFKFYHKIKGFNKVLSFSCEARQLNPNHRQFEESLKSHIHTELLISSHLTNSKTALFWLNTSIKNKDSILFDKNFQNKEKYNLSKLSNTNNIPTGKLTINKILNAKEGDNPILHVVDGREKLTWIINLSSNFSKANRVFILAHSVDKKELENKNKSNILFLFPETLIAIGISFLLILILFKRILKNINTITKTALLVNKGNKNIRSKVVGEDDIGILGQSFDSMLDFFENSIKTLDKKVDEKTKELSKSLEEKEILLKEVHHRVKNNLALTISLIELQEEDINDERTKKALVDIQERIYTMELLHRKLYESTDLSSIALKKYTEDLVDTIARTYDIENNVLKVLRIEDINLNIEVAMSCGMILNELVTNSFKYAFCDKRKGKLEVIIRKNKNEINIIVKDNGDGLKEKFENIQDKTLGLKLINTIAKIKLFGTVNYRYEEGAVFIIEGKIKATNS